jgi:hypothetical protein
MKIKHVLYNSGQSVEDVPFEEVRIMRKQRVIVDSAEMGGACFGEITEIPICMIACHPSDRHMADKLDAGQVKNFIGGYCNQRSFDRLPGYVDLNLLAIDNCQTYLQSPL